MSATTDDPPVRTGAVRYHVTTSLIGLIAVPLLVSVAVVLLVIPLWLETGGWAVAGVVAVGGGVFALWYRWGSRRVRPDGLGVALAPVIGPPAYFMISWVVAMALAGNVPSAAALRFAVPGLPWFILAMVAALTATEVVVPVVLAVVLACSVTGFLWGTHRACQGTRRACQGTRPAPHRWVRLGAVALCVALVGAAAGQGIARARYVAIPTVSDEVDLGQYQPFAPGNRLVVPGQAPSLRITADWPRLDGATALYPVYAAAAQATYDPGSRQNFASTYVPCSGTGEAYNRLTAGQVDAIFVARPSPAQLAALNATGRKLTLTPLGREAFVFFVNAANPVDGLSLQQIRGIYTKQIVNWNQVGGRNQAITPYQRPDGSGSQTAMLAQVMRDVPIAEPRRDEVADLMAGVLSQVATYRNTGAAIGYSFRWYATVMNPNVRIKLLSVDGVAPTAANIRNGTYPLIGEFYAVTLGDPSPGTAALIDWLTSAEGQALIEQVGYVGR